MNLRSLPLRLRLGLAFGTVVLLSLISSLLSLRELGRLDHDLDEVVETNNAKLEYSHVMADAVHVVSRVMRTIALVAEHDKPRAHVEERKLADARAAYDAAEAALAQLPSDARGIELRDAVAQAKALARPLNDRFLALALGDQREEALALLLTQAGAATQAWQDALAANRAHIQAGNRALEADARSAFETGRRGLMVLAAFDLGLAVLLTVLLLRSLQRELGGEPAEVTRIANDIAATRLDGHIPVQPGDDGSVMAAMARMQQALTELARQMRSNAVHVASASTQIAQGNGDLSQRTEEQASALQQTAATMDQLGSAVRHNAQSAHRANELAAQAAQVAQQGGQVFNDVVQRMRGIHESSARIADIIGVIDSIAFQTNLLALNAAVEAARAGEQGRGFAVVAAEVRILAQRSAAAAREIKQLITNSVAQVQQGSERVEQAHGTIEGIVQAVGRLRDIVGDISAASQEQSTGLAQINTAVSQMDVVTQRNAAMVEEGAAAAESLRLQAEALLRTASVFRVSVSESAARATEAALSKARASSAASRHTAASTAPPARGLAP